LIYFLASIFKEKVILIHEDTKNLVVSKLEFLIDALLLFVIASCLIFKNIILSPYVPSIIVALFSAWVILTTLKLKFYLKHWTHWIAMEVFIIFMHEIPNTAVFEWKYFARLYCQTIPFWY
jgi:hypothetical protein